MSPCCELFSSVRQTFFSRAGTHLRNASVDVRRFQRGSNEVRGHLDSTCYAFLLDVSDNGSDAEHATGTGSCRTEHGSRMISDVQSD